MADRGFYTGSGVPRRRTTRQYQALVGPITSAVPAAPAIPHPRYPDRLDPPRRLTPEAFAWQPPPEVPVLPHLTPVVVVRPSWMLPGVFVWHPVTPAPAVALDLVASAVPDLIRLRPFIIPPSETRQPILPVPLPDVWPVRGIVGTVPEQSCASYIATLTDPSGRVLPGSILTSLRLTLYTHNRDNTLTIVNGRDHQPSLNANGVSVYDALQTAADGRTYNLRWRITAADTTLVDPALAFERHLALWEWTWADGSGKQEVILVVQNLGQVN